MFAVSGTCTMPVVPRHDDMPHGFLLILTFFKKMLIVLERLCSILPFVSFFFILSLTHTLHCRINITLNEIIVCVRTLCLCLVGVIRGDSI